MIDNQNSVINFMTSKYLKCSSEFDVSLIGGSFFLGLAISSILWLYCRDKWGRLTTIKLGAFLQLTGYSGVLFLRFSILSMYIYYLD